MTADMSVRELSPELAKVAQDELGEVTSRIPQDLKAIKEWLAKQAHINARTDDQWLLAFLRGCKFSLERTKEKLDNFYSMKSIIPEIGLGVDPSDSIIQEMIQNGTCLPLLKPCFPGGPLVMLARPGTIDAKKFSVLHVMRITYMFSCIQMLEDDHITVAGLRVIIDMADITVGHLAHMTPINAKKMIMSRQEATPIRQKGLHYLHTPSGIETIFAIIKSFMNEKNRNRFFVHNDDMEGLYKFIPKNILPAEYGGEGGSIKELSEYWKKKSLEYKEWFMDDIQYKTNESKRPGKPKTAETMFGIEGSFRQLNVD